VATRRRVDIFFILYLTAIVGFVVVSKERDQRDKEMQELNESIVRALIPPVPMHPEGDTLRCYVDADSNGVVIGAPAEFRTWMEVRDIGPEDSVSLSVHSVVFDETLVPPDLARVGSRTGIGQLQDNLVAFPVSLVIERCGRYEVTITARSRRVHESDGVFRYRGARFDSTLVARALIDEVERNTRAIVVIAEDTSIATPKSVPELEIGVARGEIVSSVGFEERNLVRVNLGWAAPSVAIVRGGGTLRLRSRNAREAEYLWSGAVSARPDSVTIEARAFRGAGGKDIARTTFTIRGSYPFLPSLRPSVAYSGEDINFDISVSGLDDPTRYHWKLFEATGSDRPILKAEGNGPRVTYRIPSLYGGRRFIVDATYDGRRYRVYSRRAYTADDSRYELHVVEPPIRIEAALPVRASKAEAFAFTASRYHHPRFRGEQPVDRLGDVEVEVRNENGQRIDTDVWMVRKGAFEFSLRDRERIRRGGERVSIVIRAGDSALRRSVELY
jgi:hypothetical protein